MSSLPAATATWATAAAKVPAAMLPAVFGMSGSAGYSSTGIVCRVNRELPHTSWTLGPSVENSTGRFGRARAMSASSLPETRTVPSCSTWAGSCDREETS